MNLEGMIISVANIFFHLHVLFALLFLFFSVANVLVDDIF